MDTLSEILKDMHESTTRVMPLNAIWMNKAILKADGTTSVRLTDGDRIKVHNGEIVNALDEIATHLIVSCHGNINNTTLFFKVKDITTGEESEIYLNTDSFSF